MKVQTKHEGKSRRKRTQTYWFYKAVNEAIQQQSTSNMANSVCFVSTTHCAIGTLDRHSALFLAGHFVVNSLKLQWQVEMESLKQTSAVTELKVHLPDPMGTSPWMPLKANMAAVEAKSGGLWFKLCGVCVCGMRLLLVVVSQFKELLKGAGYLVNCRG